MTDKPHMTLPNGDIIREGDYAVTRGGKKVGPLVFGHDSPFATTHPWAIPDEKTYRENGRWLYGDQQSFRDLIAKWHPVEPGPDPVAPKPAKRRKWWIVEGKAFDSARQAKTVFPGSTPIKVKECKQ